MSSFCLAEPSESVVMCICWCPLWRKW